MAGRTRGSIVVRTSEIFASSRCAGNAGHLSCSGERRLGSATARSRRAMPAGLNLLKNHIRRPHKNGAWIVEQVFAKPRTAPAREACPPKGTCVSLLSFRKCVGLWLLAAWWLEARSWAKFLVAFGSGTTAVALLARDLQKPCPQEHRVMEEQPKVCKEGRRGLRAHIGAGGSHNGTIRQPQMWDASVLPTRCCERQLSLSPRSARGTGASLSKPEPSHRKERHRCTSKSNARAPI